MAQKTKSQLKSTLVDGHVLTGEDCTDLVDSLKGVQAPVSDPTASGSATAFIDSITQDAEGKIAVTKKVMDLSGFLTLRDLVPYQKGDVQVVGILDVTSEDPGKDVSIKHGKGHYPTVRLIGNSGLEVEAGAYMVTHLSEAELTITVAGDELDSTDFPYRYILD